MEELISNGKLIWVICRLYQGRIRGPSILTVIDVFSKYAWAIPVKNKGGPEMKNAFELLFQMSNPRTPDKLQTDAGKEFLNKDVQKF